MEARASHQLHREDKDPSPALELLLTDDRPKRPSRSPLLNQLNAERQQRTRYAVEEAMAEVSPDQDFKVVVTEEAGGLAGLIAGKVAGATGRPAAVLNRRADGSYGGSARAGETDVGLYGALLPSGTLWESGAGTARPRASRSTPATSTRSSPASTRRSGRSTPRTRRSSSPPWRWTRRSRCREVSNGLLEWQEKLAPFGSGNLRPVFVTRGLRIEGLAPALGGDEPAPARRRRQGKDGRETDSLPEGAFDAAYTVYRSRYSGQGRDRGRGLEAGLNAIGVDVGGTKIAAGVVTPEGTILEETRHPTRASPTPGGEHRPGRPGGKEDGFEVGGACLAVAGFILSQENRVVFSPNLHAVEGIP